MRGFEKKGFEEKHLVQTIDSAANKVVWKDAVAKELIKVMVTPIMALQLCVDIILIDKKMQLERPK